MTPRLRVITVSRRARRKVEAVDGIVAETSFEADLLQVIRRVHPGVAGVIFDLAAKHARPAEESATGH